MTNPEGQAVRKCPRCKVPRVVNWQARLVIADDPNSDQVYDLMCNCGMVIERRVRLAA